MITLQRLILEGKGCRYKSLSTCDEFLRVMINTLAVTEVMRQQIEVKSPIAGKPGITISIVFLESHLVMHTFPEESLVELNLSSCKSFDRTKLVKVFKYFFEPQSVEEIL